MQFPQSLNRSQLPLFDAFLNSAAPTAFQHEDSPWAEEAEFLNEISLSGAPGSCRQLLGSVLRELSQNQDARWLTLVAPPAAITISWLRSLGLELDRLLLLQPRNGQCPQELTRNALCLGRSHTVVSWLNTDSVNRTELSQAARAGRTQSLNIQLG